MCQFAENKIDTRLEDSETNLCKINNNFLPRVSKMNFRKQIVLVLSVIVLVGVFAQAADDSSKCRQFAESQKGNLVDLSKVKVMRMYGPPAAKKTCKDVCVSKSFDVGFEYAGKQACCCGKIEH